MSKSVYLKKGQNEPGLVMHYPVFGNNSDNSYKINVDLSNRGPYEMILEFNFKSGGVTTDTAQDFTAFQPSDRVFDQITLPVGKHFQINEYLIPANCGLYVIEASNTSGTISWIVTGEQLD